VEPSDYVFLERIFTELPLGPFLDVITLVYRYFSTRSDKGDFAYSIDRGHAARWKDFVARALIEEHVGYTLDQLCGVHYLIDSEFQYNRSATLRGLGDARYGAVLAAFETAHDYLDPSRLDTKAAVRSMFEALEIQTKLMVTTNNLNRSCAQNALKNLALAALDGDPVAQKVVDATFMSFGVWIDGIHMYRHGQGTTEPVAPPIELAVHILSLGSSYLRLLVDIDQKQQSRHAGQ
jgi:hypothetical protein